MGTMRGNGSQSKPLIVKKSPIVLAKTFILIEFAAFAAFFGASFIAHYAKIWRSLPFAQAISFEIAEAVGILLIEIVIILYAFFQWLYEYYEIHPDKIIHAEGILLRRKTTTPLESVVSVSWHQALFGKLGRYGGIEFKDAQAKRVTGLDYVPDPEHTSEEIIERIRTKNGIKPIPPLKSLITREEDEELEFKSTFRWDIQGQKYNRALEKAAMKTVAAFLNSQGGHLIIGVDDQGQLVGIEHDYKTLNRKDPDGFHNHFTTTFKNMIGPEFRQFVQLTHHEVEDKQLAVVTVAPSPKPVYLKDGNEEEFFIRTGNSTTSLRLSEAASYIDSRFKQ